MSVLDNLVDRVRTGMQSFLNIGDYLERPETLNRWEYFELLRQYRKGNQRRQFKQRAGQPDDNLIVNFVGLVVERSISLLFGKGIEFDLPGDDETPEDEWLQRVFEVNKLPILLHKVAQNGGTMGTCFLKMVPGGYADPYDETADPLPRLIPLDPTWMDIRTDPEDKDKVVEYIIRFNSTAPNGKQMARRQNIVRMEPEQEVDSESGMLLEQGATTWEIQDWWSWEGTNGRWELMREPQEWEHDLAPVLHWQNLPEADSIWGRSDIEAILPVQDRFNFVVSNLSKIVRYHGHPKTWGRGTSMSKEQSWGADEMVMLTGDNAMLQNLEMQSEMNPTIQFMMGLKSWLFEMSRTVDIDSQKDKLGSLTNFALRVLYGDALDKLGTKRELYGDALKEQIRRLMVINGMQPVPVKIIWPEPLPVDDKEQAETLEIDKRMGLVSTQTAQTIRGYDPTQEDERIAKDKADETNVGALILRSFQHGTDTTPQP